MQHMWFLGFFPAPPALSHLPVFQHFFFFFVLSSSEPVWTHCFVSIGKKKVLEWYASTIDADDLLHQLIQILTHPFIAASLSTAVSQSNQPGWSTTHLRLLSRCHFQSGLSPSVPPTFSMVVDSSASGPCHRFLSPNGQFGLLAQHFFHPVRLSIFFGIS